MYNYNKTQISPYDPTKLAIHSILRPEDDLLSNCGQIFKKNVSFKDIVHFIREENIVIYVDFDCGIISYTGTPTKIRQINRERNYISRTSEKPEFLPSKNQYNCSFNEQHSSYISLKPYNFWDHSNDRYSMSNQYPQPKTHQLRTDSYPVFSSLRTMDNKRKGLRVSFAFSQRIYLPDGRVNGTVATVEELSDVWKPGAVDRIPPFVMIFNCI